MRRPGAYSACLEAADLADLPGEGELVEAGDRQVRKAVTRFFR
jgi:hypothetical protein